MRPKKFLYVCPVCGLRMKSKYSGQLRTNAAHHILKHNVQKTEIAEILQDIDNTLECQKQGNKKENPKEVVE